MEPARDDDGADSLEVPAAVVCAFCGRGDCSGCLVEEPTHASGVVAIVPWERPGNGAWGRLLATAQASTRGAETFFAALPSGSALPALSFAVVAELVAVGSVAALIVPLVVFGVPNLLGEFVTNGATRVAVAASTLVGIVGFAALLVGTHAVHGIALGRGARRAGAAKADRSRALRFGLYACGWDLCSSPAGALGVAFGEGIVSALVLFGASVTAPGRATTALLASAFRLDPDDARRVRNRAIALAMAVAVPAVVVVLGAMAFTAYAA